MKPSQIFGFFLALFLSLGLISLIYPKEGIALTDDYTLDYPNLTDLFVMDTVVEKDFSAIIDSDFDIDSLELEAVRIQDSVRQAMIRDSIRRWQLQLHYPEDDKSILYPLFRKLDRAASNGPVRIMHYGDSQIEGDRITGYLRFKLQGKFGGVGPGMLPAAPLVKTASIVYSASENWKRYTLYGQVDSTVTHSNYGPLATFGRFTPLERDSILVDSVTIADTTVNHAWLEFEKSNLTYRSTRVFSRFFTAFGNFSDSLDLKIYTDDSVLNEYSFAPTEGVKMVRERLATPPSKIKLEFEGRDSPDVYAVNLQGGSGVVVDNIAMRGSSGTIFKRMGTSILNTVFERENVELLILQFGGNVMPYMDNEAKCRQYGRWFEGQLKFLKELLPGVSIIVIGPSDMGVFEKGEYQSYPLLPVVRDALKQAVFNQGGVYWDMMEAMGGSQSMKAWVEANPPLAIEDYVHFNHKGASKIAQMFYNALIQDYNEYKEGGI